MVGRLIRISVDPRASDEPRCNRTGLFSLANREPTGGSGAVGAEHFTASLTGQGIEKRRSTRKTGILVL